MKLFIVNNKKITQVLLPAKVEETFLIRYVFENDEKIITLVSEDGNWNIVNNNIIIKQNGALITKKALSPYDIYEISFNDKVINVLLFCIPEFEDNCLLFDIKDKDLIKIGSDPSNNICYNNAYTSKAHSQIIKKGDSWFLEKVESYAFINNAITSSKELKSGDVIFINGLKIIWMNTFIKVNNPKNNVSITNLIEYQEPKINNSEYAIATEKEKNILLYDEDEYFFHTPQLKFNIKKDKVIIDPPPEKLKNEEIPIFITLGSTIMMGLTSMITGFMAFFEISTGRSTIVDSLPSILICISMFFACIFFPILTSKFQKKKKIKREKLRQEKYTEYLLNKKERIKKIVEEQANILRDNYISLEQCISILSNQNKKVWSREIKDADFLTLRLGVGSKKASIDIEAPTEHFDLEDDNLRTEVLKVASDSLAMENVPIAVSLIQNNIFPLILECTNKESYINGILLQLMTFYSSVDLKLVFLVDENNIQYWEKIKYLTHSVSNDKSIRFFATTEDEMKQISSYLEVEYSERKKETKDLSTDSDDKISENDCKSYYVNYEPYYLIITDNFKMAKDIPIVKKIIETNSNYGFSLLMLESTMKNLPSKCNIFANITDSSSGIFEKDLSSDNKAVFQAEYLENTDLSKCISKISNIPVALSDKSNTLPLMIEFLEMMGVGKIEQLNILNKWSINNPTMSLSAPIGVYPSGSNFELDLHEKSHGPHGLIAGSTGSGKSELIITYILSMAINYHPSEVQFVLIDYKGGGLAGAFENRDSGLKLPHLVGTITNLDTSEMNRTLVSIRSELKRRQKKFNEVRDQLGESTIDIYKYQRLYREGVIKEPIAHLFIISDEFAELKANQPDFMDELISTARIGRSLGVHLILATQKPSGVVNDQIWSNSRFRICLKVQTSADSIEMLKRPEAASIKEVGRFYLQVGYDELFEMGQSAWAGAKYAPSDKITKKVNDSIDFINNTGYIVKSINDTILKDSSIELGDQLTNIVKYLYNLAKKEGIQFNQLWLPSIPAEIFLGDLLNKYSYKAKMFDIEAIIGEYDDPDNQIQNLLTIDFINGGNCLIYGMAGSGKENLLTTIIYSICILHTPEEVNFYILDFGSEILKIFKDMPHVGDIVTLAEGDKVNNLLQLLDKEINKRKELFIDYNGNYYDYCTKSGKSVPLIITALNNYEIFTENYDDYTVEFLNRLLREGIKYGIMFISTVSSPGSVRTKTSQFFTNIVALQLADDFDYKFYLNAPKGLTPAKILGRGLIPIDDNVYEFQTAYINAKDSVNDAIKQMSNKLYEHYNYKARPIPIIPKNISSSSLLPYMEGLSAVPVGIDNKEMSVLKYDFTRDKITQIVGNTVLSTPSFVCGLIEEIGTLVDVNFTILDAARSVFIEDEGKYYNSDFDEVIPTISNDINNKEEGIKNVYMVLGVKSLFDSINEDNARILSEILNNINKSNDTYFIICDNYASFKKITLDEWYRNTVNSSCGIWIGTGINVQVAISLNSIDIEDNNLDFEDLGYVVNNGEYKVIKGLGENE